MYRIGILFFVFLTLSCKEEQKKKLTAQEIIDQSIAVCGGDLYENSTISFFFRDRSYKSERQGKNEVLIRTLKNDTISINDIRTSKGFQRFVNDTLVVLSDSLANVYANSVNSVHYFSKLPYGLNDPAVFKELVGEITIKGNDYYKIKITFDEAGGGDDFDDTYIYWINKVTMKPDFLGYDFKVNGGGTRFRAAFNERFVNGIRFVDYENMKPKDSTATIFTADSLYLKNELELLSTIELQHVAVISDSYN